MYSLIANALRDFAPKESAEEEALIRMSCTRYTRAELHMLYSNAVMVR